MAPGDWEGTTGAGGERGVLTGCLFLKTTFKARRLSSQGKTTASGALRPLGSGNVRGMYADVR